VSFRAGLQKDLEETVGLCWELNSTHVVLGKLFPQIFFLKQHCIDFWLNKI
jgi:hypothetical protein